MPKKSGLTDRSVVNHQAGKGDKSRITNIRAYRENYAEINWGRHRIALRPECRLIAIIHKPALTFSENSR